MRAAGGDQASYNTHIFFDLSPSACPWVPWFRLISSGYRVRDDHCRAAKTKMSFFIWELSGGRCIEAQLAVGQADGHLTLWRLSPWVRR
jgi:hypothetical protein